MGPDTVNIDLYNDQTGHSTPEITQIIHNFPIGTLGKGSYLWTIPSNQPAGDKYTVRIETVSYTQPATQSDYFTITTGTSPT